MSPEVSVVMSVYNGERYLREALESILNQTFTDFEFIVVDDGSNDRTWDILTEYTCRDQRIVLLRNEENIGLTRSLNKGLRRARGEFIARQDADDVSLPERLATQIEYLRSHPDVGLLGTAYYVLDSRGRIVGIDKQPLTDTEIRWQMLFHNAFCHTSVMFCGEIFENRSESYDEDVPYSQDYELWSRALMVTRGANLEVPLVRFRVHENSIEATRRDEQQQVASSIAARKMRALLPQRPLSEHEINTLRDWYIRMPQRLTDEDVGVCQLLLQLLRRFEDQQGVDAKVVHNLRRRWAGRMLARIPVMHQGGLWRSGLLAAMLREDALFVLTELPKVALSRAGKAVAGR